MYRELKSIIKKCVTSLPLTRTLYLKKRVYTFDVDEKAIQGKIRLVGHRMDLYISKNEMVPYATIREFEFLINEIRKRQIPIDDTITWAFELFLIGKYKLQSEYNKALAKSVASPSLNEDTFLAALMSRRSVRKWTSEKIDINEIEKIIDVAKWAPSSCNRQIWQTLLINKQQDKEFLREYFSNIFWLEAPLLVIVLMNTKLYCNHQRHYSYLDGGAFIQNMLLTLHVRGYGACWIGFSRWDSLNNIYTNVKRYERFYEHFKLKKEQIPISMLAVGKPDVKPKAPSRQDITNIVIKDFIE